MCGLSMAWHRASVCEVGRYVVINGRHVIIYNQDAEAARAALRDALDCGYVDAGDGLLIFKVPRGARRASCEGPPAYELYLLCGDPGATMARPGREGSDVPSVTNAQ
jgi:hypothetical protein